MCNSRIVSPGVHNNRIVFDLCASQERPERVKQHGFVLLRKGEPIFATCRRGRPNARSTSRALEGVNAVVRSDSVTLGLEVSSSRLVDPSISVHQCRDHPVVGSFVCLVREAGLGIVLALCGECHMPDPRSPALIPAVIDSFEPMDLDQSAGARDG